MPRITAAERREQHRAKEHAQREREDEQRRKGAKKYVSISNLKKFSFNTQIRNVKLLSFGADEDNDEEEETSFKKRPIFRPERAFDLYGTKHESYTRLVVQKSTEAIPDFVLQRGPEDRDKKEPLKSSKVN